MIAVAGTERSEYSPEFPVPNRTILVLLAAAVWGCPAAREAVRSISTKTRNVDALKRIALTLNRKTYFPHNPFAVQSDAMVIHGCDASWRTSTRDRRCSVPVAESLIG